MRSLAVLVALAVTIAVAWFLTALPADALPMP